MIVAGCDFGTLAAKVVLMQDGSIIASEVSAIKAVPEKVSTELIYKGLSKAGLFADDVAFAVSTGWGKKRVPFANLNVTEMPCLARGAQWLIPSARTILDIGGQSCRAMNINEAGKIIKYSSNDKCAAGTGRFFELIAEALEVEVDDLIKLALQSKDPARISTQCCVFAESEVVTLVNEGREVSDIVAGVHDSTVLRLASILGMIQITPDIIVTGGCARNERLVQGLRDYFRVEIKTPSINPQFAGAIGAAIIAQEKIAETRPAELDDLKLLARITVPGVEVPAERSATLGS